MFPAARIGDPITHDQTAPSGVVGPPQPGAVQNVMIEGLPAATVGDYVTCTGATSAGPAHPPQAGPPPSVPPSVPIITGLPRVMIGGKPAARWTPSGDTSACGVFLGDPKLAAIRTVFIGGGLIVGNLFATLAVFPGQQNAQNCGVESSRQLMLASGGNISENDLLNWALNQGLAENDPDPAERGGTGPEDREKILDQNGVPSHREPQNMNNITQAVREGRGVITSHDAGTLWNQPGVNGGHAVTVTGLEYDSNGNLQNVIINDTGTGQGAQSIPADRFQNSLRPGRDINVTDSPIW